MARIEHWPDARMAVVWLREDMESPWGSEVMPGITVHYGFDKRGENGDIALPAMLAQTLEELVKRDLIEQAKAASPREAQKR